MNHILATNAAWHRMRWEVGLGIFLERLRKTTNNASQVWSGYSVTVMLTCVLSLCCLLWISNLVIDADTLVCFLRGVGPGHRSICVLSLSLSRGVSIEPR